MAKTGVSKFRFVSPGVQVAEIDNSQIPKVAAPVGPVIIGRATRGPGLRPVKVDSYSEFVEIFGNAAPGGTQGDIWRDGGETLSPTYGAYAAQAWFKNSTPVTFVRLLGKANADKVTGGEAGWKVGASWTTSAPYAGGAFGLFLIDSGTHATIPYSASTTVPTGSGFLLNAETTGTLAAVFYARNGNIALTGTVASGSGLASETVSGGVGVMVVSNGSNKQFTAMIRSGSAGGVSQEITFDFNKDSKNYIRKVFNTNPTLADDNERQYAATSLQNYFLGETFDKSVAEMIKNTGGDGSRVLGVTLPLLNSDTDWNINQSSVQRGSTGWIIGQDLDSYSTFEPLNAHHLFRFRTLEGGAWEQKNLKISIRDIKAPTNEFEKYGSFTVEIRRASDSDEDPVPVETFSNCTLNKEDPNYIAAKIGDSYAEWSDTDRRYRDYGDYPNRSKYIYVEINPDEPWAAYPQLVPFGYRGPLQFKGFAANQGNPSPLEMPVTGAGVQSKSPVFSEAMVSSPDVASLVKFMPTYQSASFVFPKTSLREATTQGSLSSPKEAYFGVDTSLSGSSTSFDSSYVDYVLGLPDNYRNDTSGPTISPDSATQYSYIFTLDNVSRYTGSISTTLPKQTSVAVGAAFSSTQAYYLSGSRRLGASLSATGSNTYKSTLDAGFNQFTMPIFGGFDGVNILEINPFNNSSYGTGGTKNELNSYAFNSVKMAIDTCADPEVVECNMMTAPGVTTAGLTNHLMDVCQRRADSLAIIDIAGNYVPRADRSTYVASDSDSTVRGSVSDAVSTLNDRNINNSYATTYYPWVKIKDQGTGANVWCPPSVVAVGTYANTDNNFELWFAPAGFTRGGLSEGASGLAVTGLKERLTSQDRDDLYEANINPIASFPAEGIVMFGQKTLQITPSALDRVNVRRLMIHVKREVSRIAARLIFDQNVTTTWDRFKGQVVPFLDSVRMRLGLDDFKVMLDSATTTPDLIDRNIMYAKIFLKPTRSIEFIAIDFVITNSGAAFED